MDNELKHIDIEYERQRKAVIERYSREAVERLLSQTHELLAIEEWYSKARLDVVEPITAHIVTKEKFGTLECDPDYLHTLMTTEYPVIRHMEIEDFKLAFTGSSDPKSPIYCKNVTLFIDILFHIQKNEWLPDKNLNAAVYDQCRNRNSLFIEKRNIETEFSKSRNHNSHHITDQIIKALKNNIEKKLSSRW